jgi:ADP-heptose:LPS heptosyltransferase
MATPLIKRLKSVLPGASVDVVVDHVGYDLLKGNPCIRNLIPFERKNRSLKQMLRLSRILKKEQYFCSLHSKSGITNEILAWMSGIPHRISFKLKGSFQFANIILEKPIEDTHIILHNQSLLEPLGIEPEMIPPELFHDDDDLAKVKSFLKDKSLAENEFLVIHPTGKTIGRSGWNLEFYKLLLQYFFHQRIPVILVGTESEESELRKHLPDFKTMHWFFGYSVGELKELIALSGGFVGNDSGPAHIAGAWKKRRIVVYTEKNNNFYRWHPVDIENVMILIQKELQNPDLPEKISQFLMVRLHE